MPLFRRTFLTASAATDRGLKLESQSAQSHQPMKLNPQPNTARE
jgi:hypothetical protein